MSAVTRKRDPSVKPPAPAAVDQRTARSVTVDLKVAAITGEHPDSGDCAFNIDRNDVMLEHVEPRIPSVFFEPPFLRRNPVVRLSRRVLSILKSPAETPTSTFSISNGPMVTVGRRNKSISDETLLIPTTSPCITGYFSAHPALSIGAPVHQVVRRYPYQHQPGINFTVGLENANLRQPQESPSRRILRSANFFMSIRA